MRKLILALVLSGTASIGLADPIVGTWLVAPEDAEGALHVEIVACGSGFCGTIVKAFDADGQSGSDYEHLGKSMIRDMKAQGDGTYAGGTIWAPDNDRTYRSKMNFEGNTLVVRGCVAGGVICREGGRWTRVN